MSNSIPQSGEFYKHFKGNLYQIITIAKDSEDLSDVVVYQALYGDYKTYVRPLDMFISKVDSDKYPNVTQTYRFEKIDISTYSPDDIPDGVNPKLIEFLDADNYHRRLEIFNLMKDNISINTLHSISAVLDITLEDDCIENSYYLILKHLETQVKFERQGR